MSMGKLHVAKQLLKNHYGRVYGAERCLTVMGIETSCDDTGIAILTAEGKVLANVLESQQRIHTRYGGIIPPRAQDLHRSRIQDVFRRCMSEAELNLKDIDAIAITTRPGLPMSLTVGLRFAKHLARKYQKPLLPVHHMEAHALQARMEHDIPYPFLCLLISGGHCQLAFVHNASTFMLLGETLDDAPGEAFDKIARRMRLFLIPEYRSWSGGQAIEHAAKSSTNPTAFINDFPLPLSRQRNCMFSFAGFKNSSMRIINKAEQAQKTPPDCIISNYSDFCASLLIACSRHIMHRTQRALEYCIAEGLFRNQQRSLVISGGVANNDFIFNNMVHLAQQFDCHTFRPSKRYCSDNGVMIAWNGIENILHNENSLRWDYDNIAACGKAALGKPLLNAVENENIKCKWIQMKN